jgi:hypothetical protein
MLLVPICIFYFKQCMMRMNIEDVGFLGLGFHGKNLCAMYVFSIVYFMFFY